MYQVIVNRFNGIIYEILPFQADKKKNPVLKLLMKQPLNAPYYSLEILSLLVDACNELKLLKIAGSVLNSMAQMIAQLRVDLIAIINQSASDGNKILLGNCFIN